MAKSQLVERPIEQEAKPVQKKAAAVTPELKEEEVVAPTGNATRAFRG